MAVVVASGISQNRATAASGGRNLVRCPVTGNLYVAYASGAAWGQTQQIYVATSADEGATWSAEAITSGAYYQYTPSLAVDSAGTLAVVWFAGEQGFANNEFGTIMSRRKVDGTWEAAEALSDGDEYVDACPVVAVDSNADLHVAWSGLGQGTNTDSNNVYYRKRTSGGWGALALITDLEGYQIELDIQVDTSDRVHLAWTGENYGAAEEANIHNDPQIQYCCYDSGWGAIEQLTDIEGNQYGPVLTTDGDTVHLAWYGYGWATYSVILYRQKTTGWGAATQLSDSTLIHYDPTINVVEGAVNVVWGARDVAWSYQALLTCQVGGSQRSLTTATGIYYASLAEGEAMLVWTAFLSGVGYFVYFDGITPPPAGSVWVCLLS